MLDFWEILTTLACDFYDLLMGQNTVAKILCYYYMKYLVSIKNQIHFTEVIYRRGCEISPGLHSMAGLVRTLA